MEASTHKNGGGLVDEAGYKKGKFQYRVSNSGIELKEGF